MADLPDDEFEDEVHGEQYEQVEPNPYLAEFEDAFDEAELLISLHFHSDVDPSGARQRESPKRKAQAMRLAFRLRDMMAQHISSEPDRAEIAIALAALLAKVVSPSSFKSFEKRLIVRDTLSATTKSAREKRHPFTAMVDAVVMEFAPFWPLPDSKPITRRVTAGLMAKDLLDKVRKRLDKLRPAGVSDDDWPPMKSQNALRDRLNDLGFPTDLQLQTQPTVGSKQPTVVK